jgi:hypothetical protein
VEDAEFYRGKADDLELVHPKTRKVRVPVGQAGFGAYCGKPLPLAGVYLLGRNKAEEPEIGDISQGESFVGLAGNAFLARIIHKTGLLPGRLDFVRDIVKTIPVRRLLCPAGAKNLVSLSKTIAEDIQRGFTTWSKPEIQ